MRNLTFYGFFFFIQALNLPVAFISNQFFFQPLSPFVVLFYVEIARRQVTLTIATQSRFNLHNTN